MRVRSHPPCRPCLPPLPSCMYFFPLPFLFMRFCSSPPFLAMPSPSLLPRPRVRPETVPRVRPLTLVLLPRLEAVLRPHLPSCPPSLRRSKCYSVKRLATLKKSVLFSIIHLGQLAAASDPHDPMCDRTIHSTIMLEKMYR